MTTTTNSVEQIIGTERPRYVAAQRRYQQHLAKIAADLPRNHKTFAGYMMDYRLLLDIRCAPNSNDPALCWRIIRDLCDFRRWARTARGSVMSRPLQSSNAAILIRAELFRMARSRPAR